MKTKTDGIIVIICLCYHCREKNHSLPLLYMAKHFIWLNETKKRYNDFAIGYMINTCLNVNKDFIDQVEKYMYATFGEITQHFIKATLSKYNTSVFTLIMFYDTGEENHKKYFKVLSCVIYTVIKNCVCIDYLAFQLNNLSKIPVDSRHGEKSFNRILGIGIPDLLMNLMSYHVFKRT